MKVNYRHCVRILQSLLITSSLFYCDAAFASADSHLKQDVTTLTSTQFYGRKTNTIGAKRAADYIASRLTSLGYEVQEQTFQYPATFYQKATARNIIATKPSACAQCKKIIFTAHYDHLGQRGTKLYPGANDNASGVAALLYLAAYFADKPHQNQLMFVATDAEENGLHGSNYLVSQLNSADIALNINLDMLVVNKRKPRIYAFLDGQSIAQYKTAITRLSDENITFFATSSSARLNRLFDLNVDWRRASDHYSFAKAGVPYIYFGMGHDKHHHQPSDTLEHIDFRLFEHALSKIAEFVSALTR